MSRMIKRAICSLIVFVTICAVFSVYVLATTVTVLDGQVSITDTASSMSESGGTVTVSAKGGLFSQTTNTITITNASGVKAKLTFNYNASNYSNFSESSASGTYEASLDASASVTMSIKGKKAISSNTATLTLSNFSLVPISDSSDVIITYDSDYGSITVDGSAVSSGTTVNMTADGAALVATAKSGATFLGWTDGTGQLLSTAAAYTLKPAQDMTVKAAFASTAASAKPWFGVGGTTQHSQEYHLLNMGKIYYHKVNTTYLFDDLNKAATAASESTSSKVVVLMNSGTLPEGTYTIPNGVTLLIPFDAANSMYTTDVQYTASYTKPSEYRTLTMAEGANLIINGGMSISAMQKYAAGGSTYGGMPVGATGFVRMNSGSNITVNNGGALYAYGYVIGSGTVTAKSGSTVYEGFQIMDFRGGSQSTGMQNGVFPLLQYYVQNIEVPLTLEAGAAERTYTWMNMSGSQFNSTINFIGSSSSTDAMFKITSGSITKYYDPGTDRLMIKVDGNLDLSNVEISFGSEGSISSEEYVLALNGNISVTINSGTTNINQDLAMLPGAHITIKEGATVLLGEGKRIYVYDKDEWGAYVHLANTAEATARPLIYVPTRDPQINEDTTGAHLTDASILIEGTLDASKGSIYTTLHGAQITGSNGGMIKTKPGTETATYQLKDQKTSNDPADAEYAEIPITPAKLINSDATIVETGNGSADSVTTYTYTNGFWRCDTHTWGDDGICTVCGVFAIYGTSVRAGDSLGMYFYVEVQHLFPDTDSANLPLTTDGHFYANVAHAKADGSTETTEKIVGELYQDAYYRFYFTGVAAKEMADMVYVSIYDNNDTLVSNVYSESVMQYAEDLLKSIGTAEDVGETYALLRTVLVDMLNYGAACQTEFSYNKENLANSNIDDYQTFATSTLDSSNAAAEGDTNYFTDQTVTTDSALVYTFHFQNVDSDTMEAKISYKDHYDRSVEKTVDIDTELRVDVTGLAIADCNQTITCTIVYKESGDTVTTATGSIAAYANKAIELRIADATCEALMKFAQSAYGYLDAVKNSA